MCNYKYKYLIPLVIIRQDGEEYLLPIDATGVWRSLIFTSKQIIHTNHSFQTFLFKLTPRHFSRFEHLSQTKPLSVSGLLSICIFTNIVQFQGELNLFHRSGLFLVSGVGSGTSAGAVDSSSELKGM